MKMTTTAKNFFEVFGFTFFFLFIFFFASSFCCFVQSSFRVFCYFVILFTMEHIFRRILSDYNEKKKKLE